MRNTILALACVLGLLPLRAAAQDDAVQLYAPTVLVDTGVFQYILPRFSLKTQVRVALTDDAASADVVLGADGQALFSGVGETWHMAVTGEGADVTRFADWLSGDIGSRTVLAYAPDDTPIFEPPVVAEKVVAEVSFEGDAALGRAVSMAKCGRCHKVDPESRRMTIGSTPSFPVLRSLPDWADRFAAFYVLNPHPAFTQIADLTEPFDISRPSPIQPIELTLDELEAMLAYVSALEAADLGAPLAFD